MKKVLVFGGSTSSTSINKQLAAYAATLLQSTPFELIDFKDLEAPLYSVDAEQHGFPEQLVNFSKQLKSYDGFIVSLAEHNGSYAASYKNTIDWLSRIERSVFNSKPMLLMATSPGARGGASVLAAAEAYYPHLGAQITGTFSLGSFYDYFKDGSVSEAFNKDLQKQVSAFELALS